MNSFTEIILVAVAGIFVSLIIYAIERLIKYLSQRIKNERLRAALVTAGEIVSKVVKHTAQTFVGRLKAEGSFNKEMKTEALRLSCERAKDMMAEEVKAVITEAFGSLDKWILTNVEACVYDGQAVKDASASE